MLAFLRIMSRVSNTLAPLAEVPPEGQLVQVLSRIGRTLASIPTPVLVALAMAVTALRSGVAGVGPFFMIPLNRAAAGLPAPVNGFSSDLLFVLLRRVVGGGDARWWAFGGLVWIVAIGGFALWASRRARAWSSVVVLLVALSSAAGVTVTVLGLYDIFTMCGAAMVALARRWWLAAAGVGLMILTNPEHAVVASLALLLVAVAFRQRDSMSFAAVGLVASVVAAVLINLWLQESAIANPRLDLANNPVATLTSIRLFLGSWPLATYAFFGALWLPVAATFVRIQGWGRRGLAALGAIAIPAGASIATIDGTRVFVAVGTGAAVLLFRLAWRGTDLTVGPHPAVVGVLAVLLVFLPSVVVFPDPDGLVFLRLPYHQLLDFLGWRLT